MTGMPSGGNGMPPMDNGMPIAEPGMPPAGGGIPPAGNGMPRHVADRRQKPCSAPPKRRGPAYDRRPAAGPGRTPRQKQRHGTTRRPVRVVLPKEPPRLTPAAARALLRVLLKARAAQNDEEGVRL
jgi:hypothetical protein